MSNSTNQVALNKDAIRKNQRRLFELECQASTVYADTLLLIADIEEHRTLLHRNFSAAFNGNRAIAIDNIEDLYRCRKVMIDALDTKTDVEQNFAAAMTNSMRIDLLENKLAIQEKALEVATQLGEANQLMAALNEMIATANENLADFGNTMVSDNAEWIDGELEKKFAAASSSSNADIVSRNIERLSALSDRADAGAQSAELLAKQVEVGTKTCLEMGDDIATRRSRIQAEREGVMANQKRSSELIAE